MYFWQLKEGGTIIQYKGNGSLKSAFQELKIWGKGEIIRIQDNKIIKKF